MSDKTLRLLRDARNKAIFLRVFIFNWRTVILFTGNRIYSSTILNQNKIEAPTQVPEHLPIAGKITHIKKRHLVEMPLKLIATQSRMADSI